MCRIHFQLLVDTRYVEVKSIPLSLQLLPCLLGLAQFVAGFVTAGFGPLKVRRQQAHFFRGCAQFLAVVIQLLLQFLFGLLRFFGFGFQCFNAFLGMANLLFCM